MLALILKPKSTQRVKVAAEHLIEVFVKRTLGKRETKSVLKTVLSVDKGGRTVTVPAEGGKNSVVAFEDIRILFPNDLLAMTI